MNLEIANRLVKLRRQNNLSQEELAAKLGLSRQAVSKWERAESSPDTDNLILLARLYHVSLDELLRTDGPVGAAEGGAPQPQPAPPVRAGNAEDPQAQQREGRQEWWKGNPVTRALAGCYPILMTAVFLGLGFCADAWLWAWLVYLTIPVFYAGLSDGFAVVVVIVFLALGLFFRAWPWAWLVFLAIPVFYVAREAYRGAPARRGDAGEREKE